MPPDQRRRRVLGPATDHVRGAALDCDGRPMAMTTMTPMAAEIVGGADLVPAQQSSDPRAFEQPGRAQGCGGGPFGPQRFDGVEFRARSAVVQ
jgi:hypothetical protein